MSKVQNYWGRLRGGRVSRREMLCAGGAGVAGLAGAALIGCGGDEEAVDADSGSDAGAGTPGGGDAATSTVLPTGTGSPAAGQPQQGGIYRTADSTVAPHFSPFHPGGDASWANIWRRANGYYDYLWQMNDSTDPERLVTLQLAESLEQVDELTHLVKVKQANFHDNPAAGEWNSKVGGRALTTEDIVARYEFIAVPPATSNELIKNELTVSALDERTLELKTNEPYALFLEDAIVGGTEVPREMLDETVLKESPPIGTGPFMFQEYQVASLEVAVRNPDYWYAGHPYLAAKQYTILPDNATQEAAFRSRQLDTHGFQDIKEAESVAADLGDEIFVQDYSLTGQALILNIRKEPFTDERIREAITRAIDRQKIIDTVYFGDSTHESYFGSFQPENFPIGWDAVEPYIGYDPEKAKRLVEAAKSAGTYDGRELMFMLPIEAQTWVDSGRLMEEMFQDVGLNVRTEPIVRNIYLERAGPRPEDGSPSDFDITMTVYLDYEHFSSTTGSFWQNAGPEDPRIDAMIEQILRTVDAEERRQLSHELELALAQMHANFIPLLGIKSHQGYYTYVQGTDFLRDNSGRAGWQIERWLGDGRAEL